MKRRTVAIVQCRMTSSRLPGKILMPLAGASVLERFIERLRRIKGADAICLAVAEGREHDPIVDLAERLPDVTVVRGPEHDVLRRFAFAAHTMSAETIVRITSDCPLIDPGVSDAVIAAFHSADVAFARTMPRSGYPLGLDTEVISREALDTADREAVDPYEREHVSPFILRRPERFPSIFLDYAPSRGDWRLTLDYEEDYELIRRIYDLLYPLHPAFSLRELEQLFKERPDLLRINADAARSRPANQTRN